MFSFLNKRNATFATTTVSFVFVQVSFRDHMFTKQESKKNKSKMGIRFTHKNKKFKNRHTQKQVTKDTHPSNLKQIQKKKKLKQTQKRKNRHTNKQAKNRPTKNK